MLELERNQREKQNSKISWWLYLIIGIFSIGWWISIINTGFEIDASTHGSNHKQSIFVVLLYMLDKKFGTNFSSIVLIAGGVYLLYKSFVQYKENKLKR